MMRSAKPFLLLVTLSLLSCSMFAGGAKKIYRREHQGNGDNLFCPANAAYSMSYTTLSAGWGVSYRVDDNYYHQFVMDYTKYRSTCLYRTFKGYGAQLTLFRDKQYSIGLKYYTAIRRFAGHTLIPYIGISPSYFDFKSDRGLNCKPFVGATWSPFYHLLSGVDIVLNCTYGYDVPFVNAEDFTAGRHDLSATMSIGFDVHAIAHIFTRDRGRKIDEKF